MTLGTHRPRNVEQVRAVPDWKRLEPPRPMKETIRSGAPGSGARGGGSGRPRRKGRLSYRGHENASSGTSARASGFQP